VRPVAAVDELGGDAQPFAGFAHAPLHDVVDSEAVGDLAEVELAVLEGERGGASRDPQFADPREGVQDLLGDPVAEVLLVYRAAKSSAIINSAMRL
jgi:hypothetical protein